MDAEKHADRFREADQRRFREMEAADTDQRRCWALEYAFKIVRKPADLSVSAYVEAAREVEKYLREG